MKSSGLQHRPPAKRSDGSEQLLQTNRTAQIKHDVGSLPVQKQAEALRPDAPVPPPKAQTKSLDSSMKGKAESSLGADFSNVQVHTGDGVAESYQAKAVTMGSDIHVASGSSPSDSSLMGHELAHVVQQGAAGPSKQTKRNSASAQTKGNSDTVRKKDTGEPVQAKKEETAQAKDSGGPPDKRHEVEADKAGAAVAQGTSFDILTSVTSAGVTPQMLVASDIFEHEWYPLFDAIGRSLLTAGRAYPVIGLFTGILEDVWRGANDVYTALQIGGGFGTGLAIATVLRNAVALINDAAGHIKYVAQLVQDACAAIPGAQVVIPFTVAIIEVCSAIKIPAQIIIGLMDVGITITSFAHAASLEPGSTEHTNAMKLGTAYAVRVGVDVINGILDIIDAATAGAAQGGILKNAANFIGGLVRAAKAAHPLIRPIVSKILTIWVPKIIKWLSGDVEPAQRSQDPNTGEAPAEEAKTVIGGGLSLWSSLQGRVTGLFEYGLEKWEEVKAKIEEELMEFAGGEEGFENLKTSMAESIDEMAAKAADLLEVKTLASQAEEMTGQWNLEIEAIMATIEALEIPEIPDPEPADYGDNWLADAAEWVSDTASSAAHSVAAALQDTLEAIFDEGKEGLNAMIEPLIADIAGVTEFAQNVQDAANEQVAELEAQINDFTEKLRECEGFGDIFTLIIDSVWDAVFGEEEAAQPEEGAQVWEDTCVETEEAQEEVESL